MVFDDYFLAIPVYRLPEEDYYLAMNNDFEKLVSSTWDENFRQSNPDLVSAWKKIIAHFMAEIGNLMKL